MKVTVEVYGSVAAGLALDTSDIDIGICGLKANDKESVLNIMELIVKALSDKGIIVSSQIIQSASVPVIKTVVALEALLEEWKGITTKLDITFDDFAESEHPIKYGVLFTDWITIKREERPHLFPLVVLTKKLLSIRNLNIPYYGNYNYHYRWTKLLCPYLNSLCFLRYLP